MRILLWLLIPLAGILIGAAWVAWRSRPKRTPDAVEGMAEMYRIRQAMNQPMPDIYRRGHTVTVDSGAHEEPGSHDEPATQPQVTVQQEAVARPTDATFRKSA